MDMSISDITIINETCIANETDSAVLFNFVTCGVFLNLLGFLGILGNIVSMIILSRPQMRSSINYLLIGLARVDTLLILTSVFLYGLRAVYEYTGFLFKFTQTVLPFMSSPLYFISTVCHTASTYLTLTVSFDRYIAVCKPLRARSLCTYGRARIYFVAIMFFAIVYNLPKLWEGTLYFEYVPKWNETIYCLLSSSFRSNDLYIVVYVTWSFFILMHLIPCVSLLVLNVCIYRQVRRANKERQLLSRLQRREIGLATMLFAVVIVFFLCNILAIVINVVECFNVTIPDGLVSYIINASNLLVTVNSSVNFIIYVTFGEKFQRLFLLLFCSNEVFGSLIGRGDSPEATGHDDSFTSNGHSRHSLRSFGRCRNASVYRSCGNGASVRLNGTLNREKRGAAPASVYYPSISGVAYTTQTSINGSE